MHSENTELNTHTHSCTHITELGLMTRANKEQSGDQYSGLDLVIYPRKTKTLIWKDTCTPMFIAALFTIAKIWKPPVAKRKQQINPLHISIYLSIYIYTHNGLLLRHKNEWNFSIWRHMDGLEGIMLSEISQMEKDKHCTTSLTCGI